MGQIPSNPGRLGKKDREALAWILKQMNANKVFTLKLGDWEIQMSQYAFAPALALAPAVKAAKPKEPEEIPAAISGPFAAFRQPKPWEKPPVKLAEAPQGQPYEQPIDPTDPNGDVDDDALFGVGLPQEH